MRIVRMRNTAAKLTGSVHQGGVRANSTIGSFIYFGRVVKCEIGRSFYGETLPDRRVLKRERWTATRWLCRTDRPLEADVLAQISRLLVRIHGTQRMRSNTI